MALHFIFIHGCNFKSRLHESIDDLSRYAIAIQSTLYIKHVDVKSDDEDKGSLSGCNNAQDL